MKSSANKCMTCAAAFTFITLIKNKYKITIEHQIKIAYNSLLPNTIILF